MHVCMRMCVFVSVFECVCVSVCAWCDASTVCVYICKHPSTCVICLCILTLLKIKHSCTYNTTVKWYSKVGFSAGFLA